MLLPAAEKGTAAEAAAEEAAAKLAAVLKTAASYFSADELLPRPAGLFKDTLTSGTQ